MTADRKRSVIVTGASRGLGREIALRFGAAGENVLVAFLDSEEAAQAAAQEISRGAGDALAYRVDVRSSQEVDAMVRAAVERWGRIDVVVNNAGITRDGLALRMAEQDWDEVLDVNLQGPFRCIRAAAGPMTRQGSGSVINIASLTGAQGREGQANYSASKAGLIGLTKAAARELGRHNVQVNAVLPGYLATDMGRSAKRAVQEQAAQDNVLGRSTEPREVAEFIYRLSLMRNVSGQVFNLDSRIL